MILKMPQTREEVGESNRRRVLAEILFHGPIARAKIANRVRLTQATVSRITRDLIKAELIEEGEVIDESNRRGRRFIGLRINPTGRFVAGISINVFRQNITIADLANGIIATKRLQLKKLSDPSYVLSQSAKALSILIEEHDIDSSRIVGCGVIITGSMNPKDCMVHRSSLLGWDNVSVTAHMQPYLDFPVFLDSIPNAKNITARGYGVAKGCNNVALLNASLAFGCSLIVDGHLLRGAQFVSGMVGEMLVPDEKGELISLDDCAGGFAVVASRFGKTTTSGHTRGQRLVDIIALANKGDENAISALEKAGSCLAFAISNISALLRPELMLLSGPLIHSEHYCSAVKKRVIELLGAEFSKQSLRFYLVSDQEAACSLALYQSLTFGHMTNEVRSREVA